MNNLETIDNNGIADIVIEQIKNLQKDNNESLKAYCEDLADAVCELSIHLIDADEECRVRMEHTMCNLSCLRIELMKLASP